MDRRRRRGGRTGCSLLSRNLTESVIGKGESNMSSVRRPLPILVSLKQQTDYKQLLQSSGSLTRGGSGSREFPKRGPEEAEAERVNGHSVRQQNAVKSLASLTYTLSLSLIHGVHPSTAGRSALLCFTLALPSYEKDLLSFGSP